MKPVYNGYDEMNVTGAELKELFPDEYIFNGRHHSVVEGITVKEFLSLHRKIEDDKHYRIFINSNFCKVMPEGKDSEIVFFAHGTVDGVILSHLPEEREIIYVCPDCGKAMEYKRGRYGSFLGCTGYPECKTSKNIIILGNL